MAALRYRRKPLLGFRASQRQTIRFTAATPIPDDVVRDLVRYRAVEITGSAG